MTDASPPRHRFRVSAARLTAGLLGPTAFGLAVLVTSHLGHQPARLPKLVLGNAVPKVGATPVRSPSQVTRAAAKLPRRAPQGAYSTWATTMAPVTGLPTRALEAYAVAQSDLAAQKPGCRLSWPTLAGIGYVESENGGAGGGLLPTGRPQTPIIGVALTGGGDVARMLDTDDGRYDGDADLDRAVGPMQFLPSTWATWGADGDLDGVKDPQDIDDASLAAAHYLCAAGDLATATDWSRAILSYNHSSDYLAAVSSAANTFAVRSQ